MTDSDSHDQIPFPPVQIFVSYPWPRGNDACNSVRTDARWIGLRNLIRTVAEDVKRRAEKRSPPDRILDIRINRLRGLHGQHLLDTLRTRISRGDVLIMDIGNRNCTGYNSNVLIELGIALGLGKLDSAAVFVLKPKARKLPSDLAGFLVTDYTKHGDSVALSDKLGFNAALRAKLMSIAEARGMIGRKSSPEVTSDDDDPSDPTNSPVSD